MRHALADKGPVLLGAAVLLVALAPAVYQSFVFSDFEPIRIGVVQAEQTASRHVVSIALPDVSALRGHRAVLAVHLRNAGAEPKRIGLLRDGFQQNRVVLPPDGEIRWDILAPPELMLTLAAAGDAARSLELTSDADGWSVTAAEIRNYHARWGERVAVVVLPASTGGYTIQLSPAAFWVITAALFSPVLLYLLSAAPTFIVRLPGMARRLPAAIARGWKRHEVTVERGAALLGLVAVAVAQPIFEVVSNAPEFLPARSTTAATLVGTVLAICLGIPLTLFAIERVMRAVVPRAATIFHGAALMLLATAVVMPWFRRGEVVTYPWDGLISAGIGLVATVAYSRIRGVRQFLTALAPAALIVPVLFLLAPSVKQNFVPSEGSAAVPTIERTPPIVLVIFDEFPTNSLLDATGAIDAERFPNFGAFARDAYWFRNNTTVATNTSDAVPAILSGRYVATEDAVPTLRYYPVNLFTVLARHYSIFASLRFQQLCPPRVCRQNPAIPTDSVESLLSDLGLVWLHIVLPLPLTENLPPVVGEWAEFGRAPEAAQGNRGRDRRDVFKQFVSAIDDQPARLHVVHLVLPHMPFEFVPSGRQYRAPDFQAIRHNGSLLFERASAAYADTLHQRHLAQVGYADRLIGNLIARLRETGAYDKALVVITADHGASYREGRLRRQPRQQQHNLSDILHVPLIVKLPGQQQGEVVDRIVETVDILPTILDVVGAKTALRLDGRSLLDARAPDRRTVFLRDRNNRRPRRLGDLVADRAASLERKQRRFGRGDLSALYAPPSARHLLGTPPNRSVLLPAPDVQIAIHNPALFEAVSRGRDPLPIYVRGVLTTSRPEPLNVVVVVNGAVAAIARSYQDRGGHMFGTLIPETALQDGRNTVAAFVADGLPVTDP